MAHITATTKNTTSPTGKPFIFTKLRYHPPSADACGQLTDCVFVNTAAMPFAMFMLAIDTMNGGTFQYATRYPLNVPNKTPISTLIIKLSAIGTPYVVRLYPETNAQQNMTGPIEKSIPPVAMTNVTPRDKNPKKYA